MNPLLKALTNRKYINNLVIYSDQVFSYQYSSLVKHLKKIILNKVCIEKIIV